MTVLDLVRVDNSIREVANKCKFWIHYKIEGLVIAYAIKQNLNLPIGLAKTIVIRRAFRILPTSALLKLMYDSKISASFHEVMEWQDESIVSLLHKLDHGLIRPISGIREAA